MLIDSETQPWCPVGIGSRTTAASDFVEVWRHQIHRIGKKITMNYFKILKKKSKAVPLHTMEAHWGRGGIAPTYYNPGERVKTLHRALRMSVNGLELQSITFSVDEQIYAFMCEPNEVSSICKCSSCCHIRRYILSVVLRSPDVGYAIALLSRLSTWTSLQNNWYRWHTSFRVVTAWSCCKRHTEKGSYLLCMICLPVAVKSFRAVGTDSHVLWRNWIWLEMHVLQVGWWELAQSLPLKGWELLCWSRKLRNLKLQYRVYRNMLLDHILNHLNQFHTLTYCFL
jgi:hypothetical protein